MADATMSAGVTSTDRLFTEEVGGGDPAVVCLPGLGGTTRYWRSRLEPLTRSHRLVLIDLLGFGQSPKPWRRYTVDRHIGALRDILRARDPFVLVGHSMGAALALVYAARYPQQVRGLVLISVPHFGSQENAYSFFRHGPTKSGWIMTNAVSTAITCILTRRLFGRLLPYLLRDMPREVAEDLVKHTWLSSTSSLWDVIYRHNLHEDVGRLNRAMPVLCIHGDRDATAPVHGPEKLAQGLPNWEVQLLKGVDHHPFLRRTETCVSLIESLLDESVNCSTRKTANDAS